MKLSDSNEEEILQLIRSIWEVPDAPTSLGIGDDSAVLPGLAAGLRQVVTTDTMVEGVHFLRDKISAWDLGYKSLASNLSDIAAMGARPTVVFLSFVLPQDLEKAWLEEWLQGAAELGQKYRIQLLGGNMAQSLDSISLTWTVLGEVESQKLKLRSGASEGDIVAVTGVLGDSWAGLQLLLSGERPASDEESVLIAKHCRPEPPVQEGIFLGQQPSVTSLMDVSDGLGKDLQRLCRASQVGAQVELEKIPLSEAFRKVAELKNWPAYEKASQSGEEYVLLCTVRKDDFENLSHRFKQELKKTLFPLGQIVLGAPRIHFSLQGKEVIMTELGFDHWKAKKNSNV